ncbi:LCP family protein [Candidatus Microgenomates bacterium]|nr:LCP family protein [Candidatus Microgenomates bacterium]
MELYRRGKNRLPLDGIVRSHLRQFRRTRSSPTPTSPLQWDATLPPPRRLRSTFANHWRLWWRRFPTVKKVGLVAGASMVVLGGMLVLRLWLTASKIIVQDGGAAALNEEVLPSQLKGEGDGRVNILLIGIGGAEHKAGDLSDSIMIVSIDPLSSDVTLFSIPRDLYVAIPGYGSNRINAAHAFGEQYDYPGGGPKLLSETIAQSLGVPIHYYVRLDFAAFKQAVDIVGGVDLTVQEAIYDYSYPNPTLSGYEPFYLAAGPQHLDGEVALKFVRSRYTTSDFDRAKRQQQVLTALKDKALSISTLTNPLKLNNLIGTVGSHVRTNLEVGEMLKLIELAKKVQPAQITQAALTNAPDNYLASQNIAGASVLVPRSGNFNQIRRYVRSLMPDGYIKREGATITVLNGTERPGLAEETAVTLRSYGYNVVRVGNADHLDYSQTLVMDRVRDSHRYTVNYLERRFGVTLQPVNAAANATADITIIIGRDYAPPIE